MPRSPGRSPSSVWWPSALTLFSRIPTQPDFACAEVVPVSSLYESDLLEMLQPGTQMPFCQVVRTTQLKPNRVHVISPNANLNSIDTRLRLAALEVRRTSQAPSDDFLRTLARSCGPSTRSWLR